MRGIVAVGGRRHMNLAALSGQRGLLPGGQHQDHCQPGRQH